MGLSMDVRLMSKKLGDRLIPALMLRFEGSVMALAAVDTFTPPRLMLAEAVDPNDRESLGLTDGDHTFAEVTKSDNWINDAQKAGFFIVLVSAPKPHGEGELARVLVVQFPFGHVLANPGTINISGPDLMEALEGSEEKGSNKAHEDLIQSANKLAESVAHAGN